MPRKQNFMLQKGRSLQFALYDFKARLLFSVSFHPQIDSIIVARGERQRETVEMGRQWKLNTLPHQLLSKVVCFAAGAVVVAVVVTHPNVVERERSKQIVVMVSSSSQASDPFFSSLRFFCN